MAQPTNTFATNDVVGMREDLSDTIYNISPTATPFLTRAQRMKAKNTYHEWQTDTLATAATNAVIEGDDATLDAVTATTRVGNRTQISDKTVVLSGTMEAVDLAGRKSELAYQLAKKGKELKRDMEVVMTRNQASDAGSDVAARTTGSVEAWIATNDSFGAGGASGGFSGGVVAARTDGTQRAYTEDLLNDTLETIWSASQSDMWTVIHGPKNKRVASGFTGVVQQVKDNPGMKAATVINATDRYLSDFGECEFIASRFSRDRSVLILDMDYWGIAYLRPFQQFELAKTGDSEKRQMLVEYAVVAKNEASSGGVFDLTTP